MSDLPVCESAGEKTRAFRPGDYAGNDEALHVGRTALGRPDQVYRVDAR